jgi:hypothetical protein
MQKYYYVHTGHRIGLDRFRRAIAFLHALGDDDITLLCSDYRIAHEARSFGIKKSVGIDVVRNIVNIAQRGDKLIFDSEEANPLMLEDMRTYFSDFIRVSDDPNDTRTRNESLISPYLKDEHTCKSIIVDATYFQTYEKKIEIGFFFGDDDYEKELEKNIQFLSGIECAFLSGFYYFLDYEEHLSTQFEHFYTSEAYHEFITSSSILITASPQAALENLAAGNKPIYVQRADYSNNFIQLFKSLNIPIIYNYDNDTLKNTLKKIATHSYKQIPSNSNNLRECVAKVSHFYQT